MAASIKWTKRSKELVGRQFGNLTVIACLDERSKDGLIVASCMCMCGKQTNVTVRDLTTGNTKSCGCLRQQLAKKALTAWNSKRRAKLDAAWLISAKKVFRRRYADGDLTFTEFIELSQKDCYYCGKQAKISNKFNVYKYDMKKGKESYNTERAEQAEFRYNGLDRLSSKFPHDKNNVVACCIVCNRAKSDMSVSEFKEWIAAVNSRKESWTATLEEALPPRDSGC